MVELWGHTTSGGLVLRENLKNPIMVVVTVLTMFNRNKNVEIHPRWSFGGIPLRGAWCSVKIQIFKLWLL